MVCRTVVGHLKSQILVFRSFGTSLCRNQIGNRFSDTVPNPPTFHVTFRQKFIGPLRCMMTVIADASEADEELVASLGADVVVRRGDDVASRIREHFPEGVDGLTDGAVLKELVIPAVRDGGAFTSVRGFQGVDQRDIKFTTTFVRTYEGEFEKLDDLRQMVEAGAITLRVADTYLPEQAAEVHRRLEAGGTRGRLVIQF